MSVYLQNAPLDEPVYQFMDRKRAEGKPHRVAVTAVARKLCRIVFAVMRDRVPYDPGREWGDPSQRASEAAPPPASPCPESVRYSVLKLQRSDN